MLDGQSGSPLTAAADNQLAKQPRRSSPSSHRFTPRFLVGRVLGEGAYGVVEICHERRSRNSPRGSPRVHLSPSSAAPGQEYAKSSICRFVYGDVHAGESGDVGEAFACKTVERSGNSEEAWKAKATALRREGKVMRHLGKHPNIVDLEGVYDSDDRVRLVMELCDRGDLLSLLRGKTKNSIQSVDQQQKPNHRTSELSWPSLKKLSSFCRSSFRSRTGERPTGLPEHLAAGIFWQLVTAVQHCHSHRVVHRDIKLENVLLTSASPASKLSGTGTCPFTVKLADFGTATILKPGLDFTMGNVGSGAYKAPEVSQDSYHGTPADVYSLGVVLYALLTSTFPNFDASKDTVTHRSPQDFIDNELTVHLSSGVKQLIAAMLTMDPAKRPTCAQVLEHPWVLNGRGGC
ncbi:unnamed protein product [Closterium sp. Yama58-4]|nr:unnamed protein product [Closterium sp. Yama58-4]